VVVDNIFCCEKRERTKSFKKKKGLILNTRICFFTPSQFLPFFFFFFFFCYSTLAPNHPYIPITSLTKLELTRGFFFLQPRMARKSLIWNGYHFGDNLSPQFLTAPRHAQTPPVYTLWLTS